MQDHRTLAYWWESHRPTDLPAVEVERIKDAYYLAARVVYCLMMQRCEDGEWAMIVAGIRDEIENYKAEVCARHGLDRDGRPTGQ